jgi:hypothetical protein
MTMMMMSYMTHKTAYLCYIEVSIRRVMNMYIKFQISLLSIPTITFGSDLFADVAISTRADIYLV